MVPGQAGSLSLPRNYYVWMVARRDAACAALGRRTSRADSQRGWMDPSFLIARDCLRRVTSGASSSGAFADPLSRTHAWWETLARSALVLAPPGGTPRDDGHRVNGVRVVDPALASCRRASKRREGRAGHPPCRGQNPSRSRACPSTLCHGRARLVLTGRLSEAAVACEASRTSRRHGESCSNAEEPDSCRSVAPRLSCVAMGL
jgi:hypothetical protein